jgi:hypothetical protein
MRRRATLIGALALTLVVVAFGATACTLRGGHVWPFSAGLQSTVKVVCPGHVYTTEGAPIIRPRNNCTPSFTEQDVRDYVTSHTAPLGWIQVVGKPTITAVAFTTIRDLANTTGDSEFTANYPANMVVCVVELKGKFLGDGPIATAIHPFNAAFFLVDAHTGNELMEGGGPVH